MNLFRLIADHLHLFSMIYLLSHILRQRSCKNVSGKTQFLLLVVFVSRYYDMFFFFISEYNTFYKIVFIALTSVTLFLIYIEYKDSYQRDADAFPAYLLVVGAQFLTFIRMYYYFPEEARGHEVLEWFWTFSIYLEAVAAVPQFYILYKLGYKAISREIIIYLSLLGSYRFFYIFNWWYRWETEQFYEEIAVFSGLLQTSIFTLAGLLCLICFLREKEIYNKLGEAEEKKTWSTLLNPKTIQNMPQMLAGQESEKFCGYRKF